MKKARIGFLASHNGSNMQAVIDACKSGKIKATPAAVISNNRTAFALVRAEHQGIPGFHISRNDYPSPEAHDEAIRDILLAHQADVIVLGGYMQRIGPKTLAAFRNRIINIHPALLPKFGGKGMFGALVHAAVLNAKEKETGVTVHLVNEQYDEGPILAQCRVPVLDGDTIETLSARVLEKEHQLLVETVGEFVKSLPGMTAGK